MPVVARFAPSPTGFLHIGGARTALFNWLFARHHQRYSDGGIFRLRIEDTDRARSTPEAVAAIIDGLRWLGLDWDGEIVYQSARIARHAEVALGLLEAGRAYYCYCAPEELAAMREKARAEKRSVRIDSPWRDRDPALAPPGVKPVIRLRAPQTGATTISDLVLGSGPLVEGRPDITVQNEELDDLILLRADGTPTYNLSVVVDDHDMGVTHVIRGADHLRNAFRQQQIYDALGWPVPKFGHVPLILGADGAKLSKRHGALGVEAYREMGYLPEALRNYLLRLGWSHGDDEVISTDQAIEWFDIDVDRAELLDRPLKDFPTRREEGPRFYGEFGRAAARFDFKKLDSLNGHYLREAEDRRLVALLAPRLETLLGRALLPVERERLTAAMGSLKLRPKTLVELAQNALFLVRRRPIPIAEKAAALLGGEPRRLLERLHERLLGVVWRADALETAIRAFAEEESVGLGGVAQPLRAALTGSTTSPGIFEVMEVLGREESLERIADAIAG
jgi:glutamyl-tRNA synthetase